MMKLSRSLPAKSVFPKKINNNNTLQLSLINRPTGNTRHWHCSGHKNRESPSCFSCTTCERVLTVFFSRPSIIIPQSVCDNADTSQSRRCRSCVSHFAKIKFFSVSVSPRVIGLCIQTCVKVDTMTAKVAVLSSRVRAQNTKDSFFHSQNIFILTIYVMSTVYAVLRHKQIRYKKKKVLANRVLHSL